MISWLNLINQVLVDRVVIFVLGLIAGAFALYWRERLWFRIEAFERFRRELSERDQFVKIKRHVQAWANRHEQAGYNEPSPPSHDDFQAYLDVLEQIAIYKKRRLMHYQLLDDILGDDLGKVCTGRCC